MLSLQGEDTLLPMISGDKSYFTKKSCQYLRVVAVVKTSGGMALDFGVMVEFSLHSSSGPPSQWFVLINNLLVV